jgi:hypothetical protein
MKNRPDPDPALPLPVKPQKQRVTIRIQTSDGEGMLTGWGDKTYELRLTPARSAQMHFLLAQAVKEVRRIQLIDNRLLKRAGKAARGPK